MNFKPLPAYPTYPPYHTGLYLEDYFSNYLNTINYNGERTYIDIMWTSYYNNPGYGSAVDPNLQQYLDSLDQTKKYFTVIQHDNGVQHKLPDDTIVFAAGSNQGYGKIKIPIPLIAAPPPKYNLPKKYVASFVGSSTHQIRTQMTNIFSNDQRFHIHMQQWSPTIDKNKVDNYLHVLQSSRFALAPRGYGMSSFRMYEAIYTNIIPVYIYDQIWLPYSNDIDWESFSILCNSSNLSQLKNKILSITPQKYLYMLTALNNVSHMFTMNGVSEWILKNVVKY